jgi:hypothetical protein
VKAGAKPEVLATTKAAKKAAAAFIVSSLWTTQLFFALGPDGWWNDRDVEVSLRPRVMSQRWVGWAARRPVAVDVMTKKFSALQKLSASHADDRMLMIACISQCVYLLVLYLDIHIV